MESLLEQSVFDLTAHKESIIKGAIKGLIGSNWKWKDVANRGQVIKTKFDDEVFIFDGKPLVKFKKPTYKKESTSNGIEIKLKQDISYMILNEEFDVVH